MVRSALQTSYYYVYISAMARRGASRPSARQPRITFYWDNPPGPRSGGTVERVWRGQVYERDVGPTDWLEFPRPPQPWACGMSSRCIAPFGMDDWRQCSMVATFECPWARSK